MISIIICSRTQFLNDLLIKNLKKTVGCAYELIVIDNSENKYSIFEAYNIGIETSTGDYLCFIHDDILFHTKDWGNVINTIFNKNKDIGLIGVAGAKIKTKMPSAWWNCSENQKVMHIIQHHKDGKIETQCFGFNGDSLQEVVAIDGVFMVMRKELNIFFHSQMKGFHNYDLNLCFECVKKRFKIFVTNEIMLEHFSTGTTDSLWIDSTYKLHNLYRDILPLNILESGTDKTNEIENAKRFIKRCLQFNRNTEAFFIWKRLVFSHPYSKFHFTFVSAIIKNMLKR